MRDSMKSGGRLSSRCRRPPVSLRAARRQSSTNIVASSLTQFCQLAHSDATGSGAPIADLRRQQHNAWVSSSVARVTPDIFSQSARFHHSPAANCFSTSFISGCTKPAWRISAKSFRTSVFHDSPSSTSGLPRYRRYSARASSKRPRNISA
jgi:hypothetical protein